MHAHDEMAIVIGTEGILESTQFSCRELLHEDQVLFTNAKIPHASRYYIENKPTRGVTIEFHPAVLHRLGYPRSSPYPRSVFMGKLNMPRVGQLARMIEDEMLKSDQSSLLMATALARQIISLVLREWPQSLIRRQDANDHRYLPRHELVRSIEIMSSMSPHDFRVPFLAGQVNRSTSTFSRLFTHSTGISPHKSYSNLLLGQAADLLLNTDRQIKEIALDLGFRNFSHFSNVFRQRWKMTPTEFREKSCLPDYF
ncbi:helix-turn-helix domain-containing protein [Acidicapsa ligni]|uniref:helix-turn-helix domain-containing protein n=1 Tax=Acidicapsa ligni TaxID=542300 RepID=UPI0021E00D50|nr:AraC family transcriptional regulator [Acidicapsa ligni]